MVRVINVNVQNQCINRFFLLLLLLLLLFCRKTGFISTVKQGVHFFIEVFSLTLLMTMSIMSALHNSLCVSRITSNLLCWLHFLYQGVFLKLLMTMSTVSALHNALCGSRITTNLMSMLYLRYARPGRISRRECVIVMSGGNAAFYVALLG